MTVLRRCLWLILAMLLVAGCSSGSGGNAGSGSSTAAAPRHGWVEDDVTFIADGLTLYGTYRHDVDAPPGPAALLISESGNTDRNGDNAVAGPVGNMRQLAEYLSGKGIATLRYDKVGTGKTGHRPVCVAARRRRQRRLHHRRQGRGPLSREPAGHRPDAHSRSTRSARAPCTPWRWPPTPRRTRRRSTRSASLQPLAGPLPRHHHRPGARRRRRRREGGRQDAASRPTTC